MNKTNSAGVRGKERQFPDDVLSIISAFSKPLPRKSSYWSTQTLDEMIADIMRTYERYIKQSDRRPYTLEHCNTSHWTIHAWINGKRHSILHFTLQDIYAWDGSFHCPSVHRCVSPTLRLSAEKLTVRGAGGSNQPYKIFVSYM